MEGHLPILVCKNDSACGCHMCPDLIFRKLLLPVSGVLAALAAAYLAWKLHYNQ